MTLDVSRFDLFLHQDVSNACGEHVRLAGTRSGEDNPRTLNAFNCLALLVVEVGEGVFKGGGNLKVGHVGKVNAGLGLASGRGVEM